MGVGVGVRMMGEVKGKGIGWDCGNGLSGGGSVGYECYTIGLINCLLAM